MPPIPPRSRRYDWESSLFRDQPWSAGFVETEYLDFLKAAQRALDPTPSFDANDPAIRRQLAGRYDWEGARQREHPWRPAGDAEEVLRLLQAAQDALDPPPSLETNDPGMGQESHQIFEPKPMRTAETPGPGTEWIELFDRLLQGLGARPERPLYQSRVPLTGFLGPQRTPRGSATVMNIGVNLDGQEWLIPQLTPNQEPEDLQALLSGRPLTPEQAQRITDRAIEFALELEERQPGTFPRYNSVLASEADARGESAGKGLIAPLPAPRPAYPGRD